MCILDASVETSAPGLLDALVSCGRSSILVGLTDDDRRPVSDAAGLVCVVESSSPLSLPPPPRIVRGQLPVTAAKSVGV